MKKVQLNINLNHKPDENDIIECIYESIKQNEFDTNICERKDLNYLAYSDYKLTDIIKVDIDTLEYISNDKYKVILLVDNEKLDNIVNSKEDIMKYINKDDYLSSLARTIRSNCSYYEDYYDEDSLTHDLCVDAYYCLEYSFSTEEFIKNMYDRVTDEHDYNEQIKWLINKDYKPTYKENFDEAFEGAGFYLDDIIDYI